MKKKIYLLIFSVMCLKTQSQNLPSYIPTNGLVAFYTFSGNANDASVNRNNGTINGGVMGAADRFGVPNNAYSFDGTSGYIDIPSLNAMQYRPITYSAWVIVDSYFPLSPGHKFRSIIGRHQMFEVNDGILGFYADQNVGGGAYDNTFLMWRGGGIAIPPNSGAIPPINTWTHITFTQDASGNFAFYQNGVLTNSGIFTNTQNFNTNFRIGSGNAPENYFWNNKLDDIGLWNRALTASEVVQLYHAANTAPTDITLNPSSVFENAFIGTSVGTLSTTDDEGGTFTYTFVRGTGDSDNSSFTLQGDKIKTAKVFDYETKSVYSIRLKVTDNGGLSFEKQFAISITDIVNESFPTAGLVAWYPFNGNANDESGNGNHGTITGSVSLTTDRNNSPNNAYLFDGSYSYIQIPSLNNYQYNPVTYSGWVKISSYFTSSIGYQSKFILGREQRYNTQCGAFLFASQPDYNWSNQLMYHTGASGTLSLGYGNQSYPSLDTWLHFAFTMDINSNWNWYINGVLTNSGTFTYPQTANIPFRVGAPATDEGFFGNWDNKIDDIAVYNRVLSATEVAQLFTAKINQTITFSPLANTVYGNSPFNLTASSTSGLPVSFTSSNTSVATVSGNTITIVGAGTTTITASQNGNDFYYAATPLGRSLIVNKATLTATADNKTKSYGEANPSLTVTYLGFKGTDNANSLTTQPVTATTATITSNAGTYPITLSGGSSTNYSLNLINGILTISKANQAITFNAVPDKTVTDAPFSIEATASSGLTVIFTTTSDKIILNANQVTIVKSGRATIAANQPGNVSINPANLVEKSFCIKPGKPIVSISNVNTETPTLTSSASSGNQWYLNGTAISGATNNSLIVTGPGVYKVQIKVDDCVSEFSMDVPIIITGDLSQEVGITTYPNPVENYLEFRGLKGDIACSQLWDMTGRTNTLVFEKRNDVHVANVQHLVAGVYLLRIQDEVSIHQVKLIKK